MREKDKFRYAEKCLYGYKRNIACLKILREDLKIQRAGNDVHAQNYEMTLDFTGEPSSPVHSYVVGIETLELRIQRLERLTKPITKLMEWLNDDNPKKADMKKILELMYFKENQPKQVMTELKVSRRTFARRRNMLVRLTIDYLGL